MSTATETDINLLANLLADKDVNVVTKSRIKSSSYDAERRTLSVPIIKDGDKKKMIQQGFIAKEIGKAIHTPAEEFQRMYNQMEESKEGIGQILSILEESRTQNLVEDTFGGMVGINTKFNTEMWTNDRFGVRDQNINDLHFMDRLNLDRKVGHLVTPEFSPEEQAFVDRAKSVRSFDDNIQLAGDISKWLYEPKPPEPPKEDEGDGEGDGQGDGQGNGNGQGGGQGGGQDQNQGQGGGGDDGQNGGTEGQAPPKNIGGGGAPADDMPEMQTQKNFEESFEEEIDENSRANTVFVPKSDPTFAESCVERFQKTVKRWNTNYKGLEDKEITKIEKRTKEFKADTKPIVMYMKQQFEKLKRADSQKRIKLSKTGKLDVRKLAYYKTTENIFKTNAKVKEGKNHGVMMLMDMSGSMGGSRKQATIKQTLLMVQLCKAINIPFAVYSFTNKRGSGNSTLKDPSIDGVDVFNYSNGDVRLVEMITSTMRKHDYDFAFKCLIREMLSESREERNIGGWEYMGGTPTTEALHVLSHVAGKFKDEAQLEILNTIILTDGDCNYPTISTVTNGNYGYSNDGITKETTIVDHESKRQYSVEEFMSDGKIGAHTAFSNILGAMMKDRLGSNIINIRIDDADGTKRSLKRMSQKDNKSGELMKELKKKFSVNYPLHGVDTNILSFDNDIVTELSDKDDLDGEKARSNEVINSAITRQNAKVLANLIMTSISEKLS